MGRTSIRASAVHLSVALMLIACAAAAADPGQAQTTTELEAPPAPRFMPTPEEFTDPGEQALLNAVMTRVASAETPAAALSALDEALAKLREPTELRGLLQFSRAGLLMSANRSPQAIDAIEESIRLLPGYSGPLISAASVYAFSNQPGRGADYLLRAMDADPATVMMIEDYEVGNLMHRLKAAGEERRIRAVSERLLEIGWVGSTLGSRSSLAADAIERRLSAGDVDGARDLVPKLLLPRHSYALLVDNSSREIWPDVEKWAGPRLERQWSIYLSEARARWAASKDVSTVRDYSSALLAAGHDETALRDILPLFSADLNPDEDDEMLFVVSGIAGALARKGRWQEADALFERMQRVWPLGSRAMALNITANRARILSLAGNHKEAVSRMDEAIADARRWGPEVNQDAIEAMHHARACALHELGRGAEAGVSLAIAASRYDPALVADLHLCTGNFEAARRALIEGLNSDATRQHVLLYVQQEAMAPAQSDYARKMHARAEALRADPALLSKVAEFGRLLPFASNAGAPPERR